MSLKRPVEMARTKPGPPKMSYRGKESFVRDGIPAMPVGDFLPALSAGAALPLL